jgi:hypothetical protein
VQARLFLPGNNAIELVLSTNYLLKFIIALQNGKLLKPESIAGIKNWKLTTEFNEAGYGVFRTKAPGSEDRWIGHLGGALGFLAALL